MEFKTALASLLRPPPTPPSGQERFRVQWWNPASRTVEVERFATEWQAKEKFHEIMDRPRGVRARLEIVERGSGGRWEQRSRLLDGPARTTTRAGAPAAVAAARTGATKAGRAATMRRLGLPTQRRVVNPCDEWALSVRL